VNVAVVPVAVTDPSSIHDPSASVWLRHTLNARPSCAGHDKVTDEPGATALWVARKAWVPSVGLKPSRYSARFDVPSASGSPAAVWPRLPKLAISQASGRLSASVSGFTATGLARFSAVGST